MKRLIALPTLALAFALPAQPAAADKVYGVKIIENCGKRAHPKKCRWRRHRLRVIEPHIQGFLQPVGACETGTGSYNLRVGLRITNPSGKYRGRYQFDFRSWGGAGGSGDPVNGSWLEQAYRAVRWLGINGRSSWPNC